MSKVLNNTAKIPTMPMLHTSMSWRLNVNSAIPVVTNAHMKSARGRLRTIARGCRPNLSCDAFCKYAFYDYRMSANTGGGVKYGGDSHGI